MLIGEHESHEIAIVSALNSWRGRLVITSIGREPFNASLGRSCRRRYIISLVWKYLYLAKGRNISWPPNICIGFRVADSLLIENDV